jgi:hypothetical protein
MADIFLSYAEEDREVARKIAGLLESAGWLVWWDRKIPEGVTWRHHIVKALLDMRCMVVLWSANSINSEWVKEEAEEGRSAGKLLPVLIEPVTPPIGFRSIQSADLANWDGSGDALAFRQLVSDLQVRLGKPHRMAIDKRKIFFSYSRSDKEFASQLAKSLRSEGIFVWLDVDIPVGVPWDRAIQDALESADSLLVILSPSAVDSENVMDEVSLALERKKQIIPLLYRPCNVPLRLRRLQYIDFTGQYDNALRLLLSHLISVES